MIQETNTDKTGAAGDVAIADLFCEGPFEVYEDYENGLHIIDGETRVMLSDSFAYDGSDAARLARMEWIAQALTDAWQAHKTGDNMPIPQNAGASLTEPHNQLTNDTTP